MDAGTLCRTNGESLQKMLPSLPPNGVISLMTVSFADFLQSPTPSRARSGMKRRVCPEEKCREARCCCSRESRPLSILFLSVLSWPKKCVLGCVIPPAGAVARSRNLGQTFLAISVCAQTADARMACRPSKLMLPSFGFPKRK